MSATIFTSPSKYIQGKNELNNVGKYVHVLGKKPLILSDQTVWEITGEQIQTSFNHEKLDFHFVEFNGEASINEIDRVVEQGKENNVDLVLGVGGGKTLDAAKAIADGLDVGIVIVPTTASTDAPTSALSVIYSDEGVFESYKFYKKNPDLVLVDTAVVAKAPARFFSSGIADAMATWVEARANVKSGGLTMAGGKPSLAAQAIAKTCEETLFAYGIPAYQAVQKGLVTKHVEAVVEANTLLSGLGFETGGLAGAHAIHNGFTVLEGDIHHLTHGEKVAYGTLVQLMLELHPETELINYIQFYQELGLPTTLKEMHLDATSFEDLLKVGEAATQEGETMKNLSQDITAEDVAHAIIAVDQLSNSLF
ncbi:glycerol dehydrogenase [Amphibacillus sp. Q70]|uniref:glycerol dehydrogenase n=1 Tax=Amphibacillus sp. Q70 TaxID=3453416 RepID=UPI003F86E4B9